MRTLLLILTVFPMLICARAQQAVSFPTSDGGVIVADLYPGGDPGGLQSQNPVRGVVLAHGGRFNKESWARQAKVLADAGFRVLAIDFRGFGGSHGPGDKDFFSAPFQLDVLAAVRYLKSHGAQTVAVVGGSFGGSAAGDACIDSKPGEIDRIVMLGGAPNQSADKLKCNSLFIVAREDTSGDGPRLPGIQKQYEVAPQPKRLIVLEGSAHAQFLFETDQSDRVMREILTFLKAQVGK